MFEIAPDKNLSFFTSPSGFRVEKIDTSIRQSNVNVMFAIGNVFIGYKSERFLS